MWRKKLWTPSGAEERAEAGEVGTLQQLLAEERLEAAEREAAAAAAQCGRDAHEFQLFYKNNQVLAVTF